MSEPTPSADLEDVLLEFLAESREMLDEVEPTLVELESLRDAQGKINDETIGGIFRLFHSLKSGAGYLHLDVIVGVTHQAETLLALIRSEQVEMTPAHTDLLCRCCDLIRHILGTVEETRSEAEHTSAGKALERELAETIQVAKSVLADNGTPSPPALIDEYSTSNGVPAATPEAHPQAGATLDITKLRRQFVQEADDTLKELEDRLLALEKQPGDREGLNEARRYAHSFKGNCGLLGYGDMERISHKVEELFEAFVDGTMVPDHKLISCVLDVMDVLQQTVAELSADGDGQITSCEFIVQLLADLLPVASDESGLASVPRAAEVEANPETAGTEEPQPTKVEPAAAMRPASMPEFAAGRPAPPATTTPAQSAPATSLERRQIKRQDIRVDLTKLDELINLVGELVIAETLVVHNPDLEGHDLENFEKAAMHLNKITRDLQDIAMSVRMVPIAGVFRKMIRLVYDLSSKLDKQIELEMVGEDTEVDKTVAELLADPMVHIIRNAADHGIESHAQRQASGKPPVGHIHIEARHEGGEVWIIIRDDGAGLDREKILAKARQSGLISGDGADLSDETVFKLVFEPGFSTATAVTDVSGRGVGMDVVKKNLEQLKGHVEVHSQLGRGSTFILRIPLTLAIIDGMLVRVGRTFYTIPMLAICESLQPARDDITIMNDGQEMVHIRSELLPVLRLHELHNHQADHCDLEDGLLVMVASHDKTVCLFVDELIGQQQTVIKGLSPYVGEVRGVSGCSILGNGEVSLILDVAGLVAMARQRGEQNARAGVATLRRPETTMEKAI